MLLCSLGSHTHLLNILLVSQNRALEVRIISLDFILHGRPSESSKQGMTWSVFGFKITLDTKGRMDWREVKWKQKVAMFQFRLDGRLVLDVFKLVLKNLLVD